MKEYAELYHNVDHSKFDSKTYRQLILPGSQEGLSKLMEAMLTPGDVVVAEEYVYPGVICSVEPLDAKFLLVEGDRNGMKPDSLENVLNNWKSNNGRTPKVIYVCPSGGNPTGATLPVKRREQIYQIARDHDLLIIEDDPYYFLQFTEVKLINI